MSKAKVKTKIIAHRGASSEAPENTLTSFKRALALGVDVIEMDIYLTKDGVPVIHHDDVFGRTIGGEFLRKATDLHYKEMQYLEAGEWFHPKFKGEKIPSLEEVLDLLDGKVELMLEIKKHPHTPDKVVEGIFKILKRYKQKQLIGSFDPKIIGQVMKTHPEYPVIGIAEDSAYVQMFLDLGVKHLALSFELLSEIAIKHFQKSGIKIWTFTVDTPEFAKYLASIPIDGIITNHPALLLNALK